MHKAVKQGYAFRSHDGAQHHVLTANNYSYWRMSVADSPGAQASCLHERVSANKVSFRVRVDETL